MIAAILGLSGPVLTDEERRFFGRIDPAGYILFRRNCVDRVQLLALTEELRHLSGRADVPILIDQEGGRVARLQPPEWPTFPPAERFAALYAAAPVSAMQAIRHNATAIALMLREAGVNVDCLPLLDVAQPGAHDIIGDRALGAEPMQVAALGRMTLLGLAEGGVVGVVKHMPGHGRALADSHLELPVVTASAEDLETDLEPFRALATAPMAMTAHVVYPAWDADSCATLSPTIIGEVIRGTIGFDGLLMSDDLGMKALDGGFADRAAGAIAAGCDVALHCSGGMVEMAAVADGLDTMTPAATERLDRAMATIAGAAPQGDMGWLTAERDRLLALS